MHALKMTAGY